MEEQNSSDLLNEVQKEMYVDPVPRGVRFVNYVVDQVVMGAIINAGTYAFKYVVTSRGENYKNYVIFQETMSGLMAQFALSLVVIFFYYLIFEAVTKGRTFGKILTGTIAITQDGSPFTFKHALMRTLCRLIPFEAFSAFGYLPWHDSLSKTAVVRKTW
ncbi:RDD family protein [Niastella caeni]|uniref:RDD family protein n=1 Tax=Niastella caeni TaxID=2569763 RepID=A0A4S8HQT4_9BACT|nr:RDD family protein [Niastella caeni]THU36879.1 RDD family protein [Niastella caeni]